MTGRQLLFRLARRVYALGPPVPALLIMGHMRSGSTLLLHILVDNAELIGCGERNAAYASPVDLDKLVIQSRLAQRAPLRRVRYAVDQINHDQLTPNRDLLEDSRVRLVFLSREPAPTLRSILELSRSFYGGATKLEQAADYYCKRLRTLAEHARRSRPGGRSMALRYESLVREPGPALSELEAFLDLTTPLREEYRSHRFTGTRGDPSETIRAGRILRPAVRNDDELPPFVLERAEEAYRHYCEVWADS